MLSHRLPSLKMLKMLQPKQVKLLTCSMPSSFWKRQEFVLFLDLASDKDPELSISELQSCPSQMFWRWCWKSSKNSTSTLLRSISKPPSHNIGNLHEYIFGGTLRQQCIAALLNYKVGTRSSCTCSLPNIPLLEESLHGFASVHSQNFSQAFSVF